MGDGGARRRGPASPYSRTGLFPWGNTYDVPARLENDSFSSQTPCHLRPVTVRIRHGRGGRPHSVRCPACGRAWAVELRPGSAPQVAVWTA